MDDLLSRATLAYFGVGSRPWPQRDLERVQAALGDVAADLVPQITAIEDEVDRRLAEWHAMPYDKSITAVEQSIRAGHPELSDEAVLAFRWAYSYDWK